MDTILTERYIERCAEFAHEVNRLFCRLTGDYSQPDWLGAPSWQRESARKGVAGALAGNTPEESHAGWLEEKTRTGWKYGPVKDPDRKEHPCMVPYAQLPPAQRVKDALFLASVRAMAEALKE